MGQVSNLMTALTSSFNPLVVPDACRLLGLEALFISY